MNACLKFVVNKHLILKRAETKFCGQMNKKYGTFGLRGPCYGWILNFNQESLVES